MQYLLLIYDDEKARWNSPHREEITTAYKKLVGELVEKKIYLGGEPLMPSNTASSVRVREGKVAVTDGPFAETREQLGGYFLIEAADMTEASAIAARLPGAAFGTVEVRPLAVK